MFDLSGVLNTMSFVIRNKQFCLKNQINYIVFESGPNYFSPEPEFLRQKILINLNIIAKFVLKHDFDSNLKHKCLLVH